MVVRLKVCWGLSVYHREFSLGSLCWSDWSSAGVSVLKRLGYEGVLCAGQVGNLPGFSVSSHTVTSLGICTCQFGSLNGVFVLIKLEISCKSQWWSV